MTKTSIRGVEPCFKSINFDLDTEQMKIELGSKTKGYSLLKKAFKKIGFSHRQGSGYVSVKPLSDVQVTGVLKKIAKQNSWLSTCINRMDITDIGNMFDVADFVRKVAHTQKKKAQREKKEIIRADISQGSSKPAPKPSTAPKSAPQSKNIPTQQVTYQKKISKGISL